MTQCTHIWIPTCKEETTILINAPARSVNAVYTIQQERTEQGQEIVCVKCHQVKNQTIHYKNHPEAPPWLK